MDGWMGGGLTLGVSVADCPEGLQIREGETEELDKGYV